MPNSLFCNLIKTLFSFLLGILILEKNQIQVADAFEELPENIKKTTKVIFVGGGDVELLTEQVALKGLSNCLKIVGPVSKEEVHHYYLAADATILTSISEGFGLSIIEGYVYGKPAVVYDDLAAYNDICNPEVQVGVSKRTNKALAEGMVECMNKKWDKSYISEFSRNFSFAQMSLAYTRLYRKCIK